MNKQNIFCIQHSVFSNKQHIEMQKKMTVQETQTNLATSESRKSLSDQN